MANKYKIGYTAGVFDLFHIGHLNILKKAKENCDFLIVGVSTDELVAYKNTKAVIPFNERIEIVKSIRCVDQVVAQENMDKFQAWRELRFDAMFVGSDWQGTDKWKEYEEQFKAVGVDIVYFPYTKNTSSTELKAALNNILNETDNKSGNDTVPIEENFVNKFQLKKLLIKQIGNWNISIRPQQPTIGSLILSLNRKCDSLSQLTKEEGQQISHAFFAIEQMLDRTFSPVLINYLALMLVDHQVHFHVIPRYNQEVIFKNVKYSDNDWPSIHSLKAMDTDERMIFDLREYFIQNCS